MKVEELRPNKSDLPKYLYHATDESNLDSMLSNGIGANRANQRTMHGSDYGYTHKDGVFLARNDEEAAMYLSDDTDDRVQNIAIIRIPTDILDIDKLYYDDNNGSIEWAMDNPKYDGITYFYAGVIDAHKCELID